MTRHMKMTASSYVGDRPSELLGEDEPKNTGQLLPVAIALSSFDWLASLFHGKVSMRPEAPAGMVRRVGDMSTRPQPV